MKIKDVMTPDPVCCFPTDTAQKVARILCDGDIGSVPVVLDDSKKLIGMITDRDLCCRVIANGLDPKTTKISAYFTSNPVRCQPEDSVDDCERAMQREQIRRIPVVDANGQCIGIISQVDLARSEEPNKVSKTVAEISKAA